MIKWLVVSLLLASPLNAMEKEIAEDLFKKSLGEYTDLSKDYIVNLDESQKQMKQVRQVNLSVRFDTKLSGMESDFLKSNERLINEIEGYVNKQGLSSLDDVLLMRLANLHYRRAQMIWNFEDKVYNVRMKAFTEGRSKIRPKFPMPDFKKTIFFCKQLVKRYPESPFGDQAYYMIGIGLEEMGAMDQAIQIYELFLKKHASSPLSDEIMWRLAEHYYDSRQIRNAAKLYDQIIALESSSFRMKSIYKLGASYFEAGEIKAALPYFQKLYRETKDSSHSNSELLTFYEETLEYLGIMYEKGLAINIDADGLGKSVLSLAGIYRRDAQEKLARRVLLKYLRENPLRKEFPQFANQIISSYSAEGKYSLANKFRIKAISHLQDSTNWWSTNKENRSAMFDAQDFLEAEILASAQYLVEKGLEKKNQKSLRAARIQYRKFIRNYFYSPLAPQATFELAQLEYQLKNYKNSSRYFKIVTALESSKSFHQDAAFGYLWSESKRGGFDLNANVKINLTSSMGRDKKVSLTRAEKIFLNAAKFYVEKYPYGKRTQRILYKVSEIYFSKNELDNAEIAIRRILADRENVSLVSLKSLILSSEIHNLKSDWDKYTARYNQIASLSLALDQEASQEVGSNVTNDAKWADALELEEQGRLLESAKSYERIGLSSANSSVSSESFWRSALLYRRTGGILESNVNLERITDKNYKTKAQFLYIANDVRLLRYTSAARNFEKFAKVNRKDPLAQEALLAAAVLNKNLGNEKKFADLLVEFNRKEDNRLIWFMAMESYANMGATERVAQLKSKVAGFGPESVIRSDYLIARAFWRDDEQDEARSRCETIQRSIGNIEKSANTAIVSRAQSECDYYQLAGLEGIRDLVKKLKERRHRDLLSKVFMDLGELEQSKGNNFEALSNYQKAWKAIDENLFSKQGSEVFKRLVSLGKAPLIHKASLINWGVTRGEILNWERPSSLTDIWDYGRSKCERGEFASCIKTLESLNAQAPSFESKASLIRAYIMAGRENKAIALIEELGKAADWAPQIVWMAYGLRYGQLVPRQKRDLIIPVGPNRPVALVAKGYKEISEGELTEAIKTFQQAVEEDPSNALAYVGFAEIFYVTRNFSLIKKVLSDGVRNTRDESGLKSISIMVESLTDPIVYGNDDFENDFRVSYAKAFNELISKRPDRSQMFIKNLERTSVWRAELGAIRDLLGYESEKVKAKKLNQSRHWVWLDKIGKTRGGDENYFTVAESYSRQSFSPSYHFLKLSVRQRAPTSLIRGR